RRRRERDRQLFDGPMAVPVKPVEDAGERHQDHDGRRDERSSRRLLLDLLEAAGIVDERRALLTAAASFHASGNLSLAGGTSPSGAGSGHEARPRLIST